MLDRREFIKLMAMCGAYGAARLCSGNLVDALATPVRRKAAKSVIEIWMMIISVLNAPSNKYA